MNKGKIIRKYPTYKVIRKYPTEQFGNMDFEARGLESRDEISKELEYFDAVAKEYMARKELEKATDNKPSIPLRCEGTKDWYVYDRKEGKLYRNLGKEKIIKQEGEEPVKREQPF